MKPSKLRVYALIVVIAISAQLLAACSAASTPTHKSTPPEESATRTDALISEQEMGLTVAMNKLWEDHITWTRIYVIAALAELPEADAAAQRLLQNQVDIGNAIKPFYGDAAGEQLTLLLTDHIMIAVELVGAAKVSDTAKFDDANLRWYENADAIAAFLNTANPDHWPLADMQAMMKSHLDLTLEEVTARLNEDWAADVLAYDKVHDEILQMAGMLTKGIVAQFPDQFR